MNSHKNSASRIKAILEDAKVIQNRAVVDVWKEIFSIDVTTTSKLHFEISRCLNLLHDEIEYLRDEMDKTDYSSYLYTPHLDKLNNIIGVNTIPGSWDGYQKQITPEIMLCLGFCSEILPSDEYEIPEDQISEIRDLVHSLESGLDESNLPPYTKKIITKHLNNIKEALKIYVVTGAKAFSDVIQAAYGEVIGNAAAFEDSKESKEVAGMAVIWQKVKVISDNAVVLEKGISASKRLVEHASKAIDYIQGLGN